MNDGIVIVQSHLSTVVSLSWEEVLNLLEKAKPTSVGENHELLAFEGEDEKGPFVLIQGHLSGSGYIIRP